MQKRYIILLSLVTFLCTNSFAQKGKSSATSPKKGHELIFNVKNSNDKLVYLVIHYNEKLILKDSVTPTVPGKFVFKGENVLDDGMYSLVSEKKKLYLNFIIDNNQCFEYNLDTTGDVNNFSTKNTPQNEEMLKFQRKTYYAQKQSSDYANKRKEFEKIGNKDSVDYYQKKLNDLNEEMFNFINHEIIEAHPDYLFSKMQKSYLNIEVPDIKNEKGETDIYKQAAYYREHYWDNFDLGDHRFIYIPSFDPKLKEYFNKVIYHQETDTINKYVDMFLAKTEKDTFMYHYCLDWLSYQFESSKVI